MKNAKKAKEFPPRLVDERREARVDCHQTWKLFSDRPAVVARTAEEGREILNYL